MLNIVSVSRRTDIPAFYWPWFMNRVKERFACYANPFGGQVYSVSLEPEDVVALVFWSRNYQPALADLPLLEQGYKFYFHYTITGLPAEFEPNVVATDEAIGTFKQLARRYSPKHVQWRFDPIVISSKTDVAERLRAFGEIAARLEGFTERCYFSFVDFYDKTRRNLGKLAAETGVECRDPGPAEKGQMAQEMLKIAENHGLSLHACCEDLVAAGGIHKAHCVDGELIHELFPERLAVTQHQPTREQCGCFASKDIGAYDTCVHGCVYCYANVNKEVAAKRHAGLQGAVEAPALSDDPQVWQKCQRPVEARTGYGQMKLL
jgi:hypothetical protein